MSPFKESTRQFWFKTTDGKCAYEQYTEKKGFQQCNAPARHIHHIRGEAETLLRGGDPEQNVALPACQNHHVRNTNDVLGEPDASFHPDIAQAYKSYKEWKANDSHMRSINGRKTVDYSTSPFAEVGKDHKQKAQRGERYIAGDGGTDIYYENKMREKATRYLAEHPDEHKPNAKPHPKTDPSKKPKKWYDLLG